MPISRDLIVIVYIFAHVLISCNYNFFFSRVREENSFCDYRNNLVYAKDQQFNQSNEWNKDDKNHLYTNVYFFFYYKLELPPLKVANFIRMRTRDVILTNNESHDQISTKKDAA